MFAKIKNYHYLLLAVLVLGLSLTALAAPGDLDLTFGTGGKVTTPFGASSDDGASAVAIQTDGKIVVGGSSNSDFAVARYNADGSLDSTFGTGGKVVTAIGAGDDFLLDIAIQADGKIVAVGYSVNGVNDDVAVVRYNTDGSLDLTFDTDGKVTTPIGAGDDSGHSVAIVGGNIVVAGFSVVSAFNADFAVLRYKADGSLDSGFGTGGIVTTPIGTSTDIAEDVAIQTDGKIVAAGYTLDGSNSSFAVARYNPNGALDSGFGAGGIVTTPIGTAQGLANAVAIQTDGFIVAAGTGVIGGNTDFALVRYKPNGNLDVSFGAGGIVTTPIGSAEDVPYSVAIQSDGKIVAAGSAGAADFFTNFAMARYNSNGSLDGGFGTGGKVITPFGAQNDEALGMAIQTDDKIVLAGFTDTGASNDFAVARYLGAPTSGFLYVVNDDPAGNQIYGFSVNETTGALTALAGFPVATGGTGSGATTSEQITIDRLNSRLYAINDGSNTVSAYSINPTTGALTPLPYTLLILGSGNWNTIAVHPTGSPLLIGDGDAAPAVRSIQVTATIASEAVGSPFPTGLNVFPFSSEFSRNGNFFYTGGDSGTVFAGFSVSSATGILTPLAGSPFNSGNDNPVGYATDTQDRLFMTSNFFGGELNVFKTMTGIPTAAAGNPFASDLTEAADGVLHPNEQFYFVANRAFGTSSVGSFQIGGAGAATTLTPVAGSPFASGGNGTNALAINSAGTFLFAANLFSRNLTSYSVNSTSGVLTNIAIQPINTLGTTGFLTGIAYYMPPLAPTAASVTVGGRVSDSNGRSISRARVILTNQRGEKRTAITNSFGFFRFDEVQAGEIYIFEIRHKSYQFSPQIITVTDEIKDLDFVADKTW